MKRKGLRGSTEAHELKLFADNEHVLYRMRQAADTALVRHACRGKFERARAAKAYKPLVDEAARRYSGEHGSGRAYASRIFSRADRDAVANDYAASLIERVKACVRHQAWGCNDLPAEAAQMIKRSTCKAASVPLGRSRRKRRRR